VQAIKQHPHSCQELQTCNDPRTSHSQVATTPNSGDCKESETDPAVGWTVASRRSSNSSALTRVPSVSSTIKSGWAGCKGVAFVAAALATVGELAEFDGVVEMECHPNVPCGVNRARTTVSLGPDNTILQGCRSRERERGGGQPPVTKCAVVL
jgi:hypothetical protein